MFVEKPRKYHFKEECLPLPSLKILFYKLLDFIRFKNDIAYAFVCIALEEVELLGKPRKFENKATINHSENIV